MARETRRVAVVAGARTPFVKARKDFEKLSALELSNHAVRGLLDRHEVDPASIDAISWGIVLPDPKRPNLAREIVFGADLPRSIEAQTISSYCITGLRTISQIADGIATGRIDAGLAGGVETLSLATLDTFREPTTGLNMGEHMELSVKEWSIAREAQDEVTLRSHRNAVAAREKLAQEIVPVAGVEADSGPRGDTSLEALGGLDPVFDPENGTLTAGNSSPVTDGASAVLLMSEERARQEGRTPLAFLRAVDFAAIDPSEGLLMAPGVAVPRLLEREGIALSDVDLVEIHEAFAAQLLANAAAWEKGWKGPALPALDMDRVNVNGGSVAIGHPWSATGGRVVTTLAYEMARRDAKLGLVSVCAAGAMAGAMLFERD